MNIGKAIRKIREAKGMSVQELSKESEVDIDTILVMEKFNADSLIEMHIDDITEALGVDKMTFRFLALEPKDIPEDKRESFISMEDDMKESVMFFMVENNIGKCK